MWNKKTKAEKQDTLIKMKIALDGMESGRHPYGDEDTKRIIKDYIIWLRISPEQRRAIRQKWDEYFEKVKDTVIYQIVQEQRLAALRNNWARVRELADQARQMREQGDHISIPLPEFTDPAEFEKGSVISAYKKLQRTIQEMTGYPTELAKSSVWGK